MNEARTEVVIVGRLEADYYITPSEQSVIGQAGGSALYSAVGAAVWSSGVGIVARVGSNYEQDWLDALRARGISTAGVQRLEAAAEHRRFFAYAGEEGEVVYGDPVGRFARIGQPVPPELKEYNPHWQRDSPTRFGPLATRPEDVPASFRDAAALHLAPCDFVSHRILPAAAREMGIAVVTCDPAARYMQPAFFREVKSIVFGLDAFMPREAKVKNYFRSESDDLWEAAEAFGAMGTKCVVIKRGAAGQFVFDVAAGARWHIPAYPATVVDVTGAGAAFSGGFAVGLVETGDPVDAAVRGSVSASLVIESSDPFYAAAAHPLLAEARLKAQRERARRI